MALALGACDAADDVRVQELPPLERPSPEARAGLPELAGSWQFAGWELPPGDSTALQAELLRLGELRLETQRLDSLAGAYLGAGTRVALSGEVRRDGVLALVTRGAAPRYLSGRVREDTLWLEMSSLLEPGAWPAGGRAAYVREPAPGPLAWLRGARPQPAADTALADPAAPALAAVDSAAAAPPPATEPAARPSPARPAPAEPRLAAPAQPQPQRAQPEPEPEPEPDEPPPAEPQPAQPDTQAPRRPRLLGQPAEPDTTGGTGVPNAE